MPHSQRARHASSREMHLSFDPAPDYAGIAKAAAAGGGGGGPWLYTARARTAEELSRALAAAVEAVTGGRGALVEAVLREE